MVEQPTDFDRLMERVRSGSQEAARELFERYGEHVLRAVRRNLDGRLRRQYDSTDFAQSVWASFFQTPAEQYTFLTPEALVAFLSKVAAHKCIDASRKRVRGPTHTVTREQPLDRITPGVGPAEEVLPSAQPSPSQVAIAEEHWQKLLEKAPPHLRRVVELVREGYTYEEIAAAANVHPKAIQRLLKMLQEKVHLP